MSNQIDENDGTYQDADKEVFYWLSIFIIPSLVFWYGVISFISRLIR